MGKGKWGGGRKKKIRSEREKMRQKVDEKE